MAFVGLRSGWLRMHQVLPDAVAICKARCYCCDRCICLRSFGGRAHLLGPR